MKKVYIKSLGCPRNLVDSEVIAGLLQKAGYLLVQKIEEADLLILNSCAFLQKAREETEEAIGELLEKKLRASRLIVVGCIVHGYREELQGRFPKVFAWVSSGEIDKLPQILEGKKRLYQLRKSFLESKDTPRQVSTPSYAFLKIAEGCKKACSFCAIPKIKGPLRSKSFEQVVHEFQSLCSQKIFEVILIAQDLGAYGKDFHEDKALCILLKKILSLKEDFWLRLLYLYPDEIDGELIELIASDPRICPYIDMPFQHVNDTILKMMRRNITKKQILKTLEMLYRKIPSISLRTSFIIGFPGETEAQFSELLQFLQEHPLDQVGFFPFSSEKGTLASRLAGQVNEKIKEERLQRIIEVQQKVVQKKNRNYIGKELDALVEGYYPESRLLLRAHHQGQSPEIDGEILINDAEGVKSFGKLYRVHITDISGYDLVGRVVGKA